MDIPTDLRYTKSDEWVRREGEELVTGITQFATEQLGDIVYIQLPEAGKSFNREASYGEIESVKAVSDLYCPVAGEVVKANEQLEQTPALINEEPYGSGWLVRLRPDDPGAYDALLTADQYREAVEARS
ncbi:MAG: glycine cleavage system protein GcvH [Chloroflexota bacterium]